MSTLREELAENIDQAAWEDLVPHVKRDAVIVVNFTLGLLDAGEAIASDNITATQRWIDEGRVYKPTVTQITEWNNTPSKLFNTVIIQPYVLIQEA